MPPPQQPQHQPQPPGDGLPGLLVALFDGLAYSLEVSLHHNIGERRCRDMSRRLLLALGVAMLLTLMTPPPTPPPAALFFAHTPGDIYAAYAGTLWPYPMLGFCLLTLTAQVNQWVQASRRRRQGGPPIHTYSNGRPNLLRRYPNLDEQHCKRVVEPAVWAGIGVLTVLVLDLHVGLYFIVASAALYATVAQRARQEREAALDTTDAVYDMLAHQEAVAAEWQPQQQARPAAPSVVTPAPAAPYRPSAPAPQPQPVPPSAAAPGHLRAGLSPNLNRLLDEPHLEQ